MKRLGKSLMWSAVLAAGGWLAGCASDTPDVASAEANQQTPIPSPENFTTLGKPTKTIQTPNGPVEIYDPTQDPEVRAAFEVVYQIGRFTFGDISEYSGISQTKQPSPPRPELEIVRTSRWIHKMDLLRAGCKQVEMVPCQVYGAVTLSRDCSLEYLGRAELSACEKESLKTNFEVITWPNKFITPSLMEKKYFTEEEKIKGVYSLVGGDHCPIVGKFVDLDWRNYIGDKSGYNLEENLSLATHVNCVKWGDKITKDIHLQERD